MKRHLTFYILFLSLFALNAQEVKLTIETTSGGLKDAMTEEQRQTVTDLTLTGSMNDADFYLIRDNMRRLEFLNLKYVHVDTIPANAMAYSSEPEVILPIDVQLLGDTAFYSYNNKIYFTGEFPKLGKGVFKDVSGSNIFVSEDNLYCKKVGESIYSMDGKSLYLIREQDHWGIAEGTEIIESRALDEAWFYKFILPSSVKLIKENAFSNFHFNGTDGIGYDEIAWFSSEASVPPVLEKNAFDVEALSRFTLNVPIGSLETYQQADSQWSVFREITENFTDIHSTKEQHLSIETNGKGQITVHSEQVISSVEIISLSGRLLRKKLTDASHNVSIILGTDSDFIIRAVFKDGSNYTVKYIQ